MKKSKYVQKLALLVSGVLCLVSPMTVYAGDINGNEASIISAASGTFTYQGYTYLATSSALGALQAKLSEDSVDLDASQASEAISRMNASIGQGVSDGYLARVNSGEETRPEGDSTVSVGGETGDDSVVDSGDEFVVDDDFLNEIFDNNQNGSTEAPSHTTYASDPIDVQGIIDRAQQDRQMDGGSAEGSNISGNSSDGGAGNSGSQNGIDSTNGGQTGSNTKGAQTGSSSAAVSGNQEKSSGIIGLTYDEESGDLTITRDATSLNEDGTVEGVGLSLSNLRLLCLVLCLILLCVGAVCAVVSFRFECMTSLKKHGHVGHQTKKKVRMGLKIVLGAAIVVEVISIVAAAGGLLGFSNRAGVDRNLQSSDYYNQVYEEYKEDEAAVLEACGYPDNLLERVTVYKTGEIDEDNVLAEMDSYLKKYEESVAGTTDGILISDENRATLELELTDRYAAITAVDFIKAMKQFQSGLGLICVCMLTGMALLAIFDCVVLIKSHHSKYKPVKTVTISVFIATIVVLAVLVMILWKRPYQNIVVYPESLYGFVTTFVKWSIDMYIWVVGAAFAAFCALMVWGKMLKKR